METDRLNLLAGLRSMTNDEFNQQPGPGKWSIAQVLLHLVIAEEGMVRYTNKKLQYSNTLKTSGLVEKVKVAALKFCLWLPLKYKVPKWIDDVPASASFDDLNQRWHVVRTELNRLIGHLEKENLLNKNVFKHPVIKRINIFQALGFIQFHFNHHLLQIVRVKKSIE